MLSRRAVRNWTRPRDAELARGRVKASAGAPRPIVVVSVEWDVVDLVESSGKYQILGFLDPSATPGDRGIPILGPDEAWPEIAGRNPGCAVILAMDSPDTRARLFDYFGAESLMTLISESARVSPRSIVGCGTIIQHGATVMPYARVGRGCKLNLNASVHHEAVIGDFCTLAPAALILGRVEVGSRSYVGAGAIVRERRRIGEGAVIGAGAVVVEDVPAGAVVVGVPAKRRLA